MISFLRGVLLEKTPAAVIVDVGGVGYELSVSVPTFTHLPNPGAEVKLRVHTHVREDALLLYGFVTADEKTLFEKLISVSGIGPKLAMAVLSGLSSADLVAAIRAGQTERLVKIPGVGKKTAERIVLELRDKLDGIAGGAAPPVTGGAKLTALTDLEMDVVSALVNFGSARPVAETAVRKASTAVGSGDFETLFRKSLELAR